jgi:hypothetical protein
MYCQNKYKKSTQSLTSKGNVKNGKNGAIAKKFTAKTGPEWRCGYVPIMHKWNFLVFQCNRRIIITPSLTPLKGHE